MKKLINTALISLALVSLNAFATVKDEVTKVFNVADNASLSITNVNGNLTFLPGNSGEIKVVAEIIAEDQHAFDRIKLDMENTDQVVSIKTRYKKSTFNNRGGVEVNYRIWLPENTQLRHSELVNGDVNINVPLAGVEFDLVNGDLMTDLLSGNVDISTVNGNMTLKLMADAKLDNLKLNTVNGKIHVAMPESANLHLDVDTVHGRISNDFGLTVDRGHYVGSSLSGQLGNGHVMAKISSVNGSIDLVRL